MHRVGHGAGQVGKARHHVLRRHQVLLARKAPHPAPVAQHVTLGNAHPRLVAVVVVGMHKLHRVRGHQRQPQARGQLRGGLHVRLVLRTPGTLHLKVKAVRKHPRHVRGQLRGARLVTAQQSRANGPGLRATKQHQPLVVGAQIGPVKGWLVAALVGRPHLGEQQAQAVVTGGVLRQQQHPWQRLLGLPWGVALGLSSKAGQHHLNAQNRLDAGLPRRTVKLDCPKHVVQVGERQRRLPVGRSRLYQGVDTGGAIDHRKVAMNAQMNKHAADSRGRP